MLDANTLQAQLGNTRWCVRMFDEVDSTNTLIKEALKEGRPEGMVVVALSQQGGYGRQGRVWASPRGGVYFSLLLRPLVDTAQVSSLSLVAALALRDALQETGLPEVLIKWPNDVLLHTSNTGGKVADTASGNTDNKVTAGEGCNGAGRVADKVPDNEAGAEVGKVAGISLEHVCGGICLGVGINIFPQGKRGELSKHAKRNNHDEHSGHEHRRQNQTHCASQAYPSAFLATALLNQTHYKGNLSPQEEYLSSANVVLSQAQHELITTVVVTFLRLFDERYQQWVDNGFAFFCTRYDESLYNQGSKVVLETIERKILLQGIVCGVDTEGRLLLRQPDGSVIAASSGEVHTLRTEER